MWRSDPDSASTSRRRRWLGDGRLSRSTARRALDGPFLGSGLLLGAVALAADGPLHLYGCDLDKRVIRVAELEAELRHSESPLRAAQLSALEPPAKVLASVDAPEGGVCGIVTNPPFGAVDMNGNGANGFELAQDRLTPIEVLAVEQCLQLLAPGGRMGIVLPQSVLSNKRLQYVREYLRTHSQIDAILSLPGEASRCSRVSQGVGNLRHEHGQHKAPRVVWTFHFGGLGHHRSPVRRRRCAGRCESATRSDYATWVCRGSTPSRRYGSEHHGRVADQSRWRWLPAGGLAERIFLGKTLLGPSTALSRRRLLSGAEGRQPHRERRRLDGWGA